MTTYQHFFSFLVLLIFLPSTNVYSRDLDVQQCAECHKEQFSEWQGSQHAHANRLVTPEIDNPRIEKLNNPEWPGDPVAVIGVEPLIQYLVEVSDGRLQTFGHGWDTEKEEWFNTFNDDRQPHEWGHWSQRAMNWNSRCAYCHTTDFQKNYDSESDGYTSTWTAQGINCMQCHGDLSEHLANPDAPYNNSVQASKIQIEHSCASCHARREELTEDFKAGEDFHNHYRLTLADDSATFHADGQVNDEDFEYNSFTFSKLHHKGISCLDCHNPHSGKTILPVANNALCMSCHTPPGVRGAKPIVPDEHTHHIAGSTGASCVNCHMQENTFMARDDRRDHAFASPDPVLSKELNIPNSCNTCHEDQTIDWAIEWTDTWYGEAMNNRSRARARLINHARNVSPGTIEYLLPFTQAEEIDSWRASLTLLLGPWAQQRSVREYLINAMNDPSPLVRSAAIRMLESQAGSGEIVEYYRNDPVRLVRLDASWATINSLDKESLQYKEIIQYLDTIGDQPAGVLRKGQLALHEGNLVQAEHWFRKALEWDPSAHPHFLLGSLLHSFGRTEEAIMEFRAAMSLDSENFEYPYSLSLLYAEQGALEETISFLETSLTIQPEFGRGWYNLSLAYAQTGQLEKSIRAIAIAERFSPGNPEVPYAAATLHVQVNDAKSAKEAAERALQIDPGYEPAQQFLLQLFKAINNPQNDSP